jgi:CRISPR type I-E-associated protein CasB/Cse2
MEKNMTENPKKNDSYYQAPREFIRLLNELSLGDKAILRRADDPQRLAPFWQCFNPAKKLDEKLSSDTCVRMIPFAGIMKGQPITEEKQILKGVGLWLRANKEKINLRRIEGLFASESIEELTEDLLTIAAIAKDGQPEIDFGKLYWDLSNFANSFKRQKTLRSWAKDFFSN